MNKSVLLQIISFFQQEDYLSAIKYLENLLNNQPDDVLYQTYLATAYLCLDEVENAQLIYWHLLLNYEDQLKLIAESIFELAQLQIKQKNVELAISLYQQGWEFDAQSLSAYLNLAQCLTIVSRFEEAICVWQDLIVWQPDLITGYEKLGLLWQNTHQYTNAIDIYQQGLQKQPDYLPILINLAFCYLKNQQLSLARQSLQKILSYNPQYYSAYGDLGYLDLLEQNLAQTFKCWHKLVTSQPKIYQQYLAWYENQISNHLNSQNGVKLNTELITIIQQTKLNHSSDSITNNLNLDSKLLADFAKVIADIYFEQHKYDRAINFYQQALKYDLVSADIYTNLIISYAYTNQAQLIPNYLQKLIYLDSQKVEKLKLQLQPKTNKNNNLNLVETPNNFYLNTLDFVEQKKLTNKFYPLKLDSIINLKPPQTIDRNIHSSFYFPTTIQLPSPFVVEIPQGRFYLREDEASSAVISNDNYLLGDLSPESPALSPNHPQSHPRHHSLFNKTSSLPSPTKINGNVVVLAGLLNNIYFHWLFDILPRIYLLELAKINLAEVDYFLVDNRAKFQQESLIKIGINSDKILPLSLSSPTHIQADNLIVPSYAGTIAWMPQWSCHYLKNVFLDSELVKVETKNRLYISRNKSSNRRLINEQEVVDFLDKYDFKVINLELLSVSEQAQLLAQSEIVISPHGSGLSNLVFCQPETKIIEIFSPNYVYPCYWLVSNLVNLDYYYLVGEVIGSYCFDQFIYSDSRFEDIYLDIDKLKKLLNKIG